MMLTPSIRHQIAEFTAKGNQYLEQAEATGDENNYAKAIQQFVSSYKLALLLNEEGGSKVWCAFNLGAAHVAGGDASRGVSILQTVLDQLIKNPNLHQNSEKSDAESGDVYYNLGCGFDRQKNVEKALENYERALTEYGKGDCKGKQAQTHVKLGNLHLLGKDYTKAQESFSAAADLYQRLEDYDNATHCMLYETDAALRNLRKGDSDEECKKILENCCTNCQKVKNTSLKGRLMCEIGFLYLKLAPSQQTASQQQQVSSKALACFEACIDKCKNHHDPNPQNRAIALQNAGGILVTFGHYQDAVIYLKEAAQLHGKLGNRNVQGQCFCTLGYAQFKLEEYADANEAYLHSLQAFKDTDDRRCQWQAYEGMAAIASLNEDLEKAQEYYVSALGIQGHNKEASERLVDKLQSVLQRKVAEVEAPRGKLAIMDKPYSISPSPRETFAHDYISSSSVVPDARRRAEGRSSHHKAKQLRRGRRSYSDIDQKPVEHIARGLSNVTRTTNQTLESSESSSFRSTDTESLSESDYEKNLEKHPRELIHNAASVATAPVQHLSEDKEVGGHNKSPHTKLHPQGKAAGPLLESGEIQEESEESARSTPRSSTSSLSEANMPQVYREQMNAAEEESDDDLTTVSEESKSSYPKDEVGLETPTKPKIPPQKPQRNAVKISKESPRHFYKNNALYTQSLSKSSRTKEEENGITGSHIYESIKTVNFSPNAPVEKSITPESDQTSSDESPEEIQEELEEEPPQKTEAGATPPLSSLYGATQQPDAPTTSSASVQQREKSEAPSETARSGDPPVGFTTTSGPASQQQRPLPDTPDGKEKSASKKKKKQKSSVCQIM